jgi:hypothetical protein
VWPLYGQEDAEAELRGLSTGLSAQAGNSAKTAVHSLRSDYAAPVDEIFSLLRECGITDIKHHNEHFAMEFCDDCGAPLYCDREAELVHAEMPEDAPQVSGHFH